MPGPVGESKIHIEVPPHPFNSRGKLHGGHGTLQSTEHLIWIIFSDPFWAPVAEAVLGALLQMIQLRPRDAK